MYSHPVLIHSTIIIRTLRNASLPMMMYVHVPENLTYELGDWFQQVIESYLIPSIDMLLSKIPNPVTSHRPSGKTDRFAMFHAGSLCPQFASH